MHPWSQALQEYEEMSDLYDEARQVLETRNQTVQMLVRVGYAEPTEPSARRGVDAILR
jgi:exonuclease VII small subunit